jgi:hypothetical protein
MYWTNDFGMGCGLVCETIGVRQHRFGAVRSIDQSTRGQRMPMSMPMPIRQLFEFGRRISCESL